MGHSWGMMGQIWGTLWDCLCNSVMAFGHVAGQSSQSVIHARNGSITLQINARE
jgi:hypothetical protein